MKAIFLCYAVDTKDNEYYSGLSVAGNKFQNNVIKYMKKYFDDFEIIVIPPIAAFPKDRRLFFRKKRTRLMGVKKTEVSFLNITGIKQVWQIISCYLTTIKSIQKGTVLITYNFFPQIGIPAFFVKKIKKCKLYSIIADLPIDNMVNRDVLSKIFLGIGHSLTKRLLNKTEYSIVLNKQAWLEYASRSKYIVIDGGMEDSEYNKRKRCWSGYHYKKKNIMYSGSLDKYSGILNLINAMKLINNKEICLDIYGDGEMRDYVESLNMGNIRYHGKLSNEEVLKRQRDAWILINPRPIDDPIALVTFPSKIFEYMVSGTPVISTKLNGFNEEYNGKIIFANKGLVEELADCINKVNTMSDEELSQIASDAFAFIGERKLWSYQCKKIANFIYESMES